MRDYKLRIGKRKQLKAEGWVSAYVQPTGKKWKRIASRSIRKRMDIASGCAYKKMWGYFEWS